MNRNKDIFNESRHERPFNRPPAPSLQGHALRDDTAALHAIAHSEGWLTPPPEVTRVILPPWQQAVFWGLRVYIVVMLVVMGFGFVRGAGG